MCIISKRCIVYFKYSLNNICHIRFIDVRLNLMVRECCYYPLSWQQSYLVVWLYPFYCLISLQNLFVFRLLLDITQIHTEVNLFICLFLSLMVFNDTVKNISAISWQSVLLVEDPKKTPPCRKSLTNVIT
jgi:hypothetical protein